MAVLLVGRQQHEAPRAAPFDEALEPRAGAAATPAARGTSAIMLRAHMRHILAAGRRLRDQSRIQRAARLALQYSRIMRAALVSQ